MGKSSGVLAQVGTDSDWAVINTTATHSVAIKTNGTLWATGSDNKKQCGGTGNKSVFTQLGTDTDWKDARCFQQATILTKLNDDLYTMGQASQYQLGNATTTPDLAVPVKIGTGFTLTGVHPAKWGQKGLAIRLLAEP